MRVSRLDLLFQVSSNREMGVLICLINFYATFHPLRHATGSFHVKHSVYTTHVGSWLHRHRLVHTRTHIYIRTCARVYRVARKWRWSRRASHSINTLPPAPPPPTNRRCTPTTPLSLLFLSFSPILSSIHRLPLCTVADVFAHPPGRGTIRWKRAFGRRLGKEILRSAEFFDTRSSWTIPKKETIEKKTDYSRESLRGFIPRKYHILIFPEIARA